MPRKRTGYDAACYYDGKLLGRCTKADSDAYTLLMNACGGDAARVLREYAYFSPELKVILEKAALMQADRSRTGGMFHAPKSSPWGEVQSCETLCPGVFLVSTASHGGTMVANEVAAVLSPAAKKCGFKDKGYICYEEDAQESVVLRELLDKKLWKIPDRIKDKGQPWLPSPTPEILSDQGCIFQPLPDSGQTFSRSFLFFQRPFGRNP